MRELQMLSDVEFEHVCADLLTAETGTHFERFQRAADGGIDLRAHDGEGLHIVQCRHYQRSGFSKLLRGLETELSNVELTPIIHLAP